MELTKKNATQTYEVKNDNYTLTATAQYEIGKGVDGISGGVVRTDEKMVASFSRYNAQNLNVNFIAVDVVEQTGVLAMINEFILAIDADLKF